MARYSGPRCKICRREGEKLFLKGARCLSPKCAVEKRSYPPGEHGREAEYRRSRSSDYSLQLREKQKMRRIYGVLERQFRRHYSEASRRPGMPGENLLIILETRLDNVVYRLGLADSRAQARQLVRHGHFAVNGRKTNIPSYIVKPGDVVSVLERSKKLQYFQVASAELERKTIPGWLSLDPSTLNGRVLSLPSRAEAEPGIEEQLIVEFYSR